jgi:RimJ/RimL family protein N-acetyltransferase
VDNGIIAYGKISSLVRRRPGDLEWFWHWQDNGEWREYDAPWEFLENQNQEQYEEKYLNSLEKEEGKGIFRAIIVNNEGKRIGSVNRYREGDHPHSILIGIAIYDNEYWNKGIGKESLRLWIEYLFSEYGYHRIGLNTYSFNERMINLARNIGFIEEGRDIEIHYWKNEWINRIRFGILKEEWEQSNLRLTTCPRFGFATLAIWVRRAAARASPTLPSRRLRSGNVAGRKGYATFGRGERNEWSTKTDSGKVCKRICR